ncbi:MAG: type II toxin-antitoxin system RelE/ParE family toxin [Nanoarchaeota archaeon]|nr:type II toxin-antitoxin system RelE/ParE family toxin [Nanoarchaeota archaeon]
MVRAVLDPKFEGKFSRIKDKGFKRRVIKHLEKLKSQPELGKPMMFERKGTREVYIAPFRLSYVYLKDENKIILLDLYHKDEQ